jgi:uncharacterized membrane protein YfcA
MDLVAGGLAVALAAFMGGVTGFGYSFVATPLLLLIGFPLPFVVTANMTVAGITRISVAYRFRAYATPKRAGGMIVGCIPGLWLGALVLTAADEDAIELVAGVILMIAAVLLWRALSAPPPRPVPGAPLAAGFAGGFLGAATSLNGVAPVLLLARDKAAPQSFQADLALYFVAANAIGLLFLAVQGAIDEEALFPTALLWLPGSLAGNWLGTSLGPRLPELAFRRLTLGIVFVAGAVTAFAA